MDYQKIQNDIIAELPAWRKPLIARLEVKRQNDVFEALQGSEKVKIENALFAFGFPTGPARGYATGHRLQQTVSMPVCACG